MNCSLREGEEGSMAQNHHVFELQAQRTLITELWTFSRTVLSISVDGLLLERRICGGWRFQAHHQFPKKVSFIFYMFDAKSV